MNNSAFSKIWVVVIVVVFIAGGIFAWQYLKVPKEITEDETVNWKVYSNEAYKYEIKYPPNLKTAKEEAEKLDMDFPLETTRRMFWTFPPKEDSSVYISISLEAIPNPEKKSLRAVLLGEESREEPFPCEIETEQDRFIRANCGIADEGLKMIVSGFSKTDSDYIYAISLEIGSLFENLTGMDFSSEISTYNLMLSTFKFFEGEVVAPPQRSAKDIKVMADMRNIGTAAEIFYDKNGSYLNLANDEDVKRQEIDIQKEIGSLLSMIALEDAYCADVTLSDGKTRYCIDSEGRRGENLGCSSTKLICISY